MKNSAEGKGEGEREKDKPQHFYSPLHPFFYDYFSLPPAIFVRLLLDKCTLLTFEKLQSFFRVFLANLHEQINPKLSINVCVVFIIIFVFITFYFWKSHGLNKLLIRRTCRIIVEGKV